jgi:DNA primase
MFPIADRRGRVIAFGGRILGEGQPKYLNSPETPLFSKGRVLYGLAQARKAVQDGAPVIVTEGYMDVIALHQAGFGGAVAPLGTALTEGHVEELWRLVPEPVLCFDGDEAGRRAAARAAERVLPLLKPGFSLRFALLPAGEDPDSLVKEQGPDAFAKVLDAARPLVDMVWQTEASRHRADTPERRAALRKALLDQARTIAERSVQDLYVAEFERRFRAAMAGPERRGAGPAAAGGFPARGTRRGAKGYERGFGGRGQAPWEDSGLRADGNVDVLALRQQQAMLAVLITHPELIDGLSEFVAQLDLPPGELDKIRHEVIKTDVRGLDSQALQNHLGTLGFSGSLGRLLSRDVFDLAPFARPEAEADRAEAGWRHLFAASQRRKDLTRERAQAQAALADDVSERNWAYLNAITRQAWSPEDEGDDDATGGGPAGAAGLRKLRG